jgi:hypothetical protein
MGLSNTIRIEGNVVCVVCCIEEEEFLNCTLIE